jgi:arginase family enzyme
MQTRILDVDGSLVRQPLLMRRARPAVLSLRDWGPRLRLACRHGSFARFEDRLSQLAGSYRDTQPFITFVGSGDFHHLSLALLRRQRGPCNLLVIDKHPDWMRGIPFLHCGTWLFHAAQLPAVQRIFHIGGASDFDNAYRWLAPWPFIRSGKIIVAPARQCFRGRWWNKIEHRPLRRRPDEPAEREGIDNWLSPYRADLASWPLYISVDKDVLNANEAVVNWDSGHLTTPEVLAVIAAFVNAAEGALAGMDVVGDWSPVTVRGGVRRLLDWSEHPKLTIDPHEAARRNEALNLRLLDALPAAGATLPQLARSAGAPGER